MTVHPNSIEDIAEQILARRQADQELIDSIRSWDRILKPFKAPPPASTGGEHHSRNETTMQVATPEALLQALLLKGGAIVSTGQIPEAISATVLAGGSITESFIREDGVGFVRVDRVPASIPHAKSSLALSFGEAIEALKLGKRVARKGWNGKGMYVRYVKDWTYTDGVDDNRKCNPLLTIKNVDESVSTWVPGINDVLAEDWQVVE